MFFREWCFGTGRTQEIDTGKELIGIDHEERDKKEEAKSTPAPFDKPNPKGCGTPVVPGG